MATQSDYALLSTHVYLDDPSSSMLTSTPWRVLTDIAFPEFAEIEGFFAYAYENVDTGEIVISYRGTDGANDYDESEAAYSGFPPEQLYFAEEFYKSVVAANPDATSISITGHSLGGGLAAAVAYRNGVEATTFAAIRTDWVEGTIADGYQYPPASSAGDLPPVDPDVPQATNITNYAIYGEIAYYNTVSGHDPATTIGFFDNVLLSGLTAAVGDMLETEFSDWKNAYPVGLGPLDTLISEVFGTDFAASIHDMGLHALVTVGSDLNQLFFNSPRLLGQMTNDYVVESVVDLVADPESAPNVAGDFLKLLAMDALTHSSGDRVLDGLIADLQLIASAGQDQQVNANANINVALIQLAVQFAAGQLSDSAPRQIGGIFNAESGGLSADLRLTGEGAPNWQSTELYGQSVLSAFLLANPEFAGLEDYLDPSFAAYSDMILQMDRFSIATSDSGAVLSVGDEHGDGNVDYMIGGGGNDLIQGGLKADVLLGMDGNDTLEGGDGNDYIYAGAGNDSLYGGIDSDTLNGGDGHDDLFGDDGDDVIVGGSGADSIVGGLGNDTLIGGDGSDVIIAWESDYVDPGAGNDYIELFEWDGGPSTSKIAFGVGYGHDVAIMGIGNVVQIAYGTSITLETDWTGYAPNLYEDSPVALRTQAGDTLFFSFGFGTHPHDAVVVEFLDGTGDVASTWTFGDIFDLVASTAPTYPYPDQFPEYYYSAWQDFADARWGGPDHVAGTADSDDINGYGGDDTLTGEAGDDWLNGGDGNDVLDGGDDNDYLAGGDGNDVLRGGDGNDRLFAEAGDDWVEGGAGNDTIFASGGAGDDTYHGGDGSDTIIFSSTAWGVAVDLAAGNATGVEIDSDLLTGIENVNGGNGDDTLSGADDDNSLASAGGNDLLDGRAGDDTLSGSYGHDTLFGGAGGDVLSGGSGDDVLDGGADTDTAVFAGNYADYQVTDLGGGSYEVVDLRSWSPDGTDLLTGVERLQFADQVVELAGSSGTVGTSGDDTLLGDGDANLIYGAGGNDSISGGYGEDTLFGGAGDDTLMGGADWDTLDGGLGNDVFLYVGTGGGYDAVNGGDGFDVIRGSGGDDVIGLQNFDASNSIESIDGGLGFNVIKGDVSSAVANLFDFSGIALTNIGLINGDQGRDTIIGSVGDDTIMGGADADMLSGGDGDDVFLYQGGNGGYDTVDGGDGFDVILGGDGDDIIGLYRFDASNSIESIDGGLGFNVIKGDPSTAVANYFDFSAVNFSNINLIDGDQGRDTIIGSIGDDTIMGGADADLLNGGGGDDILAGNSGSDTLAGGAGADTLDGGSGNDLFLYYDLLDAGDLIQGFDATAADSINLDALLDGLGIADVDRASRVQVQQAGADQDAIIAIDGDGDAIFETTLATVTNVSGTLDHNDLNLGTLV